MMEEAEYRKKIQATFDRIERSFSDVDPDVAESSLAFGVLTIVFPDKSRCILSAQPSVRQLWVALASRGTAVHFNYVAETDQWIDDKGKGLELLAFLRAFLKEMTHLDFGF